VRKPVDQVFDVLEPPEHRLTGLSRASIGEAVGQAVEALSLFGDLRIQRLQPFRPHAAGLPVLGNPGGKTGSEVVRIQ
jgi:hypothetical protein